jgi:hypothetical protein
MIKLTDKIERARIFECDSRFPRLLAALALRGAAVFDAVHLSTMATPDTSAIVGASGSQGENQEFLRCLRTIFQCADKAENNAELASQVKRRVSELFTVGRSSKMRTADNKLAAAFKSPAGGPPLAASGLLQ